MLKLFAVLIGTLPTFAFAGDFSGFYVGASVSSDTNKYNLVSKDTATRVPYGWQLDSNDTDYSYGLNAGFNKIIDAKILVGLELGYNRSNNDQKNTGICSTYWCSSQTDTNPVEFTNEKDISIVGRFGNLITPKTLIYISAGYSKAWMKADYYNGPGTRVIDTEAKILNGLKYGVGFEHFLRDNISFQGSVDWVGYKGRDFLTSTGSTYEIASDMNTIILASQSLSFGLNYHF